MHYFEMKKKSKIFWGGGYSTSQTPPPQHLRRLDSRQRSTPPLLFDKSNTDRM